MDPMDIDSIMEVPDTPDRLVARNTKGKNIERGSNDKARIVLRSNDNGSRESWPRAPRSHHGSGSAAAPGNSFSNSSFASKRLATSYETGHSQCAKSDNIQNTLSFAPREGSVEVLSEKNFHANKGKKIVSCGRSGGSQVVESGKNLPFAVQLHSQQSVADSILASRIDNGNESTNAVSAFDRGTGVESNAITLPKVVTGQKRLVRNGCISPSNIAKAQPIVVKDMNGTIGDGSSHTLCVSSSRPQAGSHARVHTADAHLSSVSKGKEIMTNPFSVEEHGGQNANSRDAVSINEIIEDDDNRNKRTCSSLGVLGGWRSARNRSKKTPLSSEEHQLLPLDHSSTLTCSESPPMLPLRQRLHLVRSQSNQHNGDHPVTDTIQKRQQGSSSSIQDGCSQSTSDDSGIIFLGSSGDTIESRPTRSRRRTRVNNSERVIEIGEGNSGFRGDGSICASSSNSADAMARQVEADEMLARDLQQQLYNEDLGVSAGEIDLHEALDLHHENMSGAYPIGIPDATARSVLQRIASTANTSRPPRVRPSMNASRTGTQARPIRSRMNRLRNHFPGRARTLSSSREGSSLFPSGMDVDLRMSILETLEAFNDMGVDNNFLAVHREFNENDYEMLLGLDENNHRHSGASTSRINNLPQSTVQNDNLEEACAVCLDTPTTGDIIRHLPCLHMFHKDCIDPWLRRKSSCPVCKCSVT